MVKFKITYRNPNTPVQFKKLMELKAKTPEEALTEIKNQINFKGKYNFLLNDIKNLIGIEQQEMAE